MWYCIVSHRCDRKHIFVVCFTSWFSLRLFFLFFNLINKSEFKFMVHSQISLSNIPLLLFRSEWLSLIDSGKWSNFRPLCFEFIVATYLYLLTIDFDFNSLVPLLKKITYKMVAVFKTFVYFSSQDLLFTLSFINLFFFAVPTYILFTKFFINFFDDCSFGSSRCRVVFFYISSISLYCIFDFSYSKVDSEASKGDLPKLITGV
jgi:hypothetical protein